jgi:hypothetical protein
MVIPIKSASAGLFQIETGTSYEAVSQQEALGTFHMAQKTIFFKFFTDNMKQVAS